MGTPLNTFGDNEVPDFHTGQQGYYEKYGMDVYDLEEYLESHPELMEFDGNLKDFYYE